MNKNVDWAFKKSYQLNNTKGYKTFGIRKNVYMVLFSTK